MVSPLLMEIASSSEYPCLLLITLCLVLTWIGLDGWIKAGLLSILEMVVVLVGPNIFLGFNFISRFISAS
jgi:hypothetical protein